MARSVAFWIVLLFVAVLLFAGRKWPWRIEGLTVLLVIAIALVGWAVFGDPVHS